MGDSAIKTAKDAPVSEQELPDVEAISEKVRKPAPATQPIQRLLAPLASLRLTVVLLALSMILVFAGTLAQIDYGLWVVLQQYFRTWVAWIPFQVFVRFFQIFFGLSSSMEIGGSFPFPGGWIIGGLMLVNLVAAHATRFKLTWKRSGVLILHTGIIVLLVGELVTGLFALEGTMNIDEGKTASFVEHQSVTGSLYELAIIDGSDPKNDEVFAVPIELLKDATKHGTTISDDKLPVDIEVHSYFPNSTDLLDVKDEDQNLVTKGDGVYKRVEKQPLATGLEQRVDMPSAYLTFKDKKTGDSLGTYLVSLWFTLHKRPQKLEAGDKSYDLWLRYKRTYKPYEVKLLDFRFDRYMGTEKARNFSSRVELIDPEAGVKREALIRMNEPLRYRGDTYYQSSFDRATEASTVLQVVRNPGWLLPYLSCILVGLGMIVHFSIRLYGFLKQKLAGRPAPTYDSAFDRYLPFGVTGIVCLYLVMTLAASGRAAQGHIDEFGRLPCLEGGRVKPIDTFARVSLMSISNRQYFKGEDGKSYPATKWLLDVMTGKGIDHKVFRVENIELLNMLELDARPGSFRYSFRELFQNREKLQREVERVRAISDQKQRTTFDQKVAELGEQLLLYTKLAMLAEPLAIPPEEVDGEWRSFFDYQKQADANARMALARLHKEGKIKVANREELDALVQAATRRLLPANAAAFDKILTSYEEGKTSEFDKAVAEYRNTYDKVPEEKLSTTGLEVFFNNFTPFYHCAVLYVFVFLLVVFSWLLNVPNLNRAAFWLAACTLVVHSIGLGLRMYLQGRPPVTNLYSSAIFIGWGAVLIGLVLEYIFRLGFGNMMAAVVGFLTTIVAHHLASGDTLEMLQAVLDTNFWLATHVVCITFGYAATFAAGFLAIGYVSAAVASSWDEKQLKPVAQATYAIICFATLLSFVGTMLGGIWADQSWGRFWGWDPKENGALIIVIWNAIILHARWSGWVKTRGMCALAIVGNMVTAWSWFGTNQLGVGLHSYGFNDQLTFYLDVFWGSQLAMLAVACIPRRHWRSGLAKKPLEV